MIRNILAVLAGYFSLAIIVKAGFSLAIVAPHLAFRSASLHVTHTWLVYVLLLSLSSALIGGYVCKLVGNSHNVVLILGVIVTTMGFVQAFVNYRKAPATFTRDQVSAMSVMEKAEAARQPDWYAWTLPVVALSGIVLGGRLRN